MQNGNDIEVDVGEEEEEEEEEEEPTLAEKAQVAGQKELVRYKEQTKKPQYKRRDEQ